MSVTTERALVPVLSLMGLIVGIVSSLGAPIVPLIASMTHVSLPMAQWTLTANLAFGAIMTPLFGRIGSGARLRATLLGALALCVLGSVIAAVPGGFGAMLLGRTLQGASLALIPLSIAVARTVVPPEHFLGAAGAISVSGVAGIGLGYPFTAVAVQVLSVRSAFWVGAALCLGVFLAAYLVVPREPAAIADRVDWVGAAMLAAGITAGLIALSRVGGGHSVAMTVALAAGSVLMLVLWANHQLRIVAPLVDLRLALTRDVMDANVCAFVAGVTVYLLFSIVTQFVQAPVQRGSGLGLSITAAGCAVLPFSVVGLVAERMASQFSDRAGVRLVLVLGGFFSLAALLVLAVGALSYPMILAAMAIGGLGISLVFFAIPALIAGSVPVQETASALGFSQLVRAVGFATGSAATATILQFFIPAGSIHPGGDGYRLAALLGCCLWACPLFMIGGRAGTARR